MPSLVAIVLAGVAQTASAAGTSIHQYRLNASTGLADDFGGPSLVPLVAVETESAGPLGVPGVAVLRPDAVPVAPGLASAPGQGYAFGFSRSLMIEGGLGGASRDGRNYAFMIELLLSDAVDRRKFFNF